MKNPLDKLPFFGYNKIVKFLRAKKLHEQRRKKYESKLSKTKPGNPWGCTHTLELE